MEETNKKKQMEEQKDVYVVLRAACRIGCQSDAFLLADGVV